MLAAEGAGTGWLWVCSSSTGALHTMLGWAELPRWLSEGPEPTGASSGWGWAGSSSSTGHWGDAYVVLLCLHVLREGLVRACKGEKMGEHHWNSVSCLIGLFYLNPQ